MQHVQFRLITILYHKKKKTTKKCTHLGIGTFYVGSAGLDKKLGHRQMILEGQHVKCTPTVSVFFIDVGAVLQETPDYFDVAF